MQFDRLNLRDDSEVRRRLAVWLPQQRWFATKSKRVASVAIVDGATIRESDDAVQFVALLSVEFDDGALDLYAVPLELSHSGSQAVLVEVSTANGPVGLRECLSSEFWLSLLMKLFVDRSTIKTDSGGELRAEVTRAFVPEQVTSCGIDGVHVHGGQQSNTSVSIGDSYFLKLFRRPQVGLNPDAEIGSFLTEHGFANTPAVAGTIIYEPLHGEPRCLAILSQRLVAESEAWSYCLSLLGQFWHRLRQHPELLKSAPLPVEWRLDTDSKGHSDVVSNSTLRELLQDSINAAALLGQRTAELHVTLAQAADDAFVPEPLTSATLQQLVSLIRREITATEDLLASRRDVVQSIGATKFAAEFAVRSAEFLNVLIADESEPGCSMIRVHGDYHLGQVLRTRDDFHIIDFEGEPDRPLVERRQKRPVFKDLAGMLRSFHYASNAGAVGLIDALSDMPPEADISGWQRCWFSSVAHAFVSTYVSGVAGRGLLPTDVTVAQRLLDVFLLEKALYELRYELNNRPDWANIPIIGLSQTLEISK